MLQIYTLSYLVIYILDLESWQYIFCILNTGKLYSQLFSNIYSWLEYQLNMCSQLLDNIYSGLWILKTQTIFNTPSIQWLWTLKTQTIHGLKQPRSSLQQFTLFLDCNLDYPCIDTPSLHLIIYLDSENPDYPWIETPMTLC